MGKQLRQQARGRGGPAYRVRRAAFIYRIGYPATNITGAARVIELINSVGHSAPLAKIRIGERIFYNPAAQGIFEGQEIEIGGSSEKAGAGSIIRLADAQIGNHVFNIEKRPGDGGKMIRTGGGSAVVLKKEHGSVVVGMQNRKEIALNPGCRVTVGVIAGQGRVIKPVVRAGKMHHMMKSIGRAWHKTSAVKVNVVDHPFGGGRGKRIKSKIAKRNAPPGAKVGHIRPRRTGKIK